MLTHKNCIDVVRYWCETFPDERLSPPVQVDMTSQMHRLAPHLDYAEVCLELGRYKRRLGTNKDGYRNHPDFQQFLNRLEGVIQTARKREKVREDWVAGLRRDGEACEDPRLARFYVKGAEHIELSELWTDYFERCLDYFTKNGNHEMAGFCRNAIDKLKPFDRATQRQRQLQELMLPAKGDSQ